MAVTSTGSKGHLRFRVSIFIIRLNVKQISIVPDRDVYPDSVTPDAHVF